MGRQGSGQKWSSRFRRGRVVRSELFVKWNHSDNHSDALGTFQNSFGTSNFKIEIGSKLSCMFQVDFFIWVVEFDGIMLVSRHVCLLSIRKYFLILEA